MVYHLLLTDPDGVHIKSQTSRHRRLIFHCHHSHIIREWEGQGETKTACKARTRPPGLESLAKLVHRKNMGYCPVYNDDEPALKRLGHITQLQRLQRAEQATWPAYRINPVILRTCRQIYQEAAYILYKQEFIFSDTDALFDFLVALGPLPSATIRDIMIMSWKDKRTMASEATQSFALLPKLVNLRQLKIHAGLGEPDWAWTQIFPSRKLDLDFNTCYYQPADIIANKVYRDMMYWLRPMHAKIGIGGVERILRIHRHNFVPQFPLTEGIDDEMMRKMEDCLMVRFWGVLHLLLEGDVA